MNTNLPFTTPATLKEDLVTVSMMSKEEKAELVEKSIELALECEDEFPEISLHVNEIRTSLTELFDWVRPGMTESVLMAKMTELFIAAQA